MNLLTKFSITILSITSALILYRVNQFFYDYGFILSIGLSIVVVSGLLYAGLSRSRQALIFGIIALLLEFFSAINPVIDYVKVNTQVIRLDLPIEPIRPERKTSIYWQTDQDFSKIYKSDIAEYKSKLAEYKTKLAEVNKFNDSENRKSPDFWVLLKLLLDAIFSAVFLPLSVWLFTAPIKKYLDDLESFKSLELINKENINSVKDNKDLYKIVYSLYKSNLPALQIADRFGISRQTVYNYIKKAKREALTETVKTPLKLVDNTETIKQIRKIK